MRPRGQPLNTPGFSGACPSQHLLTSCCGRAKGARQRADGRRNVGNNGVEEKGWKRSDEANGGEEQSYDVQSERKDGRSVTEGRKKNIG